jgi:hypothetical protein
MTRPKGMWMRTFWDLRAMVEGADYAANEAFVAGLQSLNARLDRRAERRRAQACLGQGGWRLSHASRRATDLLQRRSA